MPDGRPAGMLLAPAGAGIETAPGACPRPCRCGGCPARPGGDQPAAAGPRRRARCRRRRRGSRGRRGRPSARSGPRPAAVGRRAPGGSHRTRRSRGRSWPRSRRRGRWCRKPGRSWWRPPYRGGPARGRFGLTDRDLIRGDAIVRGSRPPHDARTGDDPVTVGLHSPELGADSGDPDMDWPGPVRHEGEQRAAGPVTVRRAPARAVPPRVSERRRPWARSDLVGRLAVDGEVQAHLLLVRRDPDAEDDVHHLDDDQRRDHRVDDGGADGDDLDRRPGPGCRRSGRGRAR